jgi:hypothetical protein
MQKLFRFFLSAKRKRRGLIVGAALWMLRQVYDVEKDELYRYYNRLEDFDWDSENVSKSVYAAIEDECWNCEHSLGFLDSAIEDLEFAY